MTTKGVLAISGSDERLPRFAGNWSLFLDVDGTLLDIAERPDAVAVPVPLREALQRIYQRTSGALALVSGRRLDDLDRLFWDVRYPAAGQHGLERRDASGTVTRARGAANQVAAAARDIRRQASGLNGVLIEHKGLTLAVHYRLAPQMQEWAATVTREVVARLGSEFRVIEGKMVFEIKPSGRDKGVAIAEFMREAPFAQRVPVFVGDDVTDEDGFAVVNAMNGLSVKVGPGSSAAQWRARGADTVRPWLGDYADYLDRERAA